MSTTKIRSASEFKNFSWNAVGSASNTITSIILLLIVTRILGTSEAGIFAIAFTTAQILLAVGLYGIRNYQVTDVPGAYHTGIYVSVRLATSFGMLIMGGLFCILSQYNIEKTTVVYVLILWKVSESLSDVFYGIMQKGGQLFIAGFSMTVRSVLTTLVFLISLLLFQNLMLSCLLLSVAGYIPLLFIDMPIARRHEKIIPFFDKKTMVDLLKVCFPIFSVSILSIIVINLPKYVIDRTMSSEFQAIYNFIAMPGTSIALLCQIIIQSQLVKLAHYRVTSQMKLFLAMISKIVLVIILFTGAFLILCNFWADDLLLILTGKDLKAYIPELLIIIIGAMFCSIAIILSAALTTLRVTRIQLYLFLANLLFAVVISICLIPRFGLNGAAGSYFFIMLFQMVLYLAVFIRSTYSIMKNPLESM